MATAAEAAQQVFNKLQNSKVRRDFAVFVKGNDEVLVTGSGTGLCAEAIEKRPRDFMGIYNRDVTEQQLVSDLLYMGMKQ